MKKLIIAALACAGLFASCDMNEEPVGSITYDKTLKTVGDAEQFRNGFYNSLRVITTGGYITYPAIQADNFIGVIINGNRLGAINNGNIYANNGDMEGLWAGMYSRIASVNFFLPRAQVLYNAAATQEEKDEMDRYIHEAKFMRAYYYYYLLDHFCQPYTPAKGNTAALGVPLTTTYNPTAVGSTYPGRSTLNQSFDFINNELDSVYKHLKAYETAYPEVAAEEMTCRMAPYVGTWTVRAMQARLALLKQDWQKAYDYANEIILSNQFPLVNGGGILTTAFANMWKSDTGTEIIFMPFCDVNERAGIGETGSTWLSIYSDKLDYIATQNALAIYSPDDVRYKTFFEGRTINVYSTFVNVPAFVKFPGNDALAQGSGTAFRNKAKVFRTAEMELIVAEAAYRLGLYTEANAALTALREKRIKGYDKTQTFSGDQILTEIQLERNRELIGEGFRISDLRRWGLPCSRNLEYTDPAYADAKAPTVVAGRAVEYTGDDYRYTWPIPSTEMQCNPQMKGQQNPGY